MLLTRMAFKITNVSWSFDTISWTVSWPIIHKVAVLYCGCWGTGPDTPVADTAPAEPTEDWETDCIDPSPADKQVFTFWLPEGATWKLFLHQNNEILREQSFQN